MKELDDDFLEWEGEMLEHADQRRIERLTHANAAWLQAKPGGWDHRAFNAILRLGRRLRRAVRWN